MSDSTADQAREAFPHAADADRLAAAAGLS